MLTQPKQNTLAQRPWVAYPHPNLFLKYVREQLVDSPLLDFWML